MPVSPHTVTAFFGGSFDPPHLGHLKVAEAAVSSGFCGRVLWVPAFSPPHKTGRERAPFADRCAMVELLIAGDPRFRLSEAEARLGEVPSYTVDVLDFIAAEGRDGPVDALLIGADSLLELHTWWRAAELVERCRIITYPRAGRPVERAALLAHWPAGTVDRLLSGVIPGNFFEISSTKIRKSMAKSPNWSDINSGVISPGVAEYIALRGLYREPEQRKDFL